MTNSAGVHPKSWKKPRRPGLNLRTIRPRSTSQPGSRRSGRNKTESVGLRPTAVTLNTRYLGKNAEVNGIKSWIETSENIQTEMHDPIVTVNDKVAWIVYYWSDQGSTDGVDFATRGKSTRIFIKENGSWLCVHGHYTLLP